MAYEEAYGPIPLGLAIDHVYERGCRYRDCVEPTHMEAVTVGENRRRGAAIISHCPKGHPYSEDNTRYEGIHRRCKACGRERARKKVRTTT